MELLEKAFTIGENRKKILADDLQKILEEYLKFRHFVRHSYGFQLEWERIEDLVKGINKSWSSVLSDNNFLYTSYTVIDETIKSSGFSIISTTRSQLSVSAKYFIRIEESTTFIADLLLPVQRWYPCP